MTALTYKDDATSRLLQSFMPAGSWEKSLYLVVEDNHH